MASVTYGKYYLWQMYYGKCNWATNKQFLWHCTRAKQKEGHLQISVWWWQDKSRVSTLKANSKIGFRRALTIDLPCHTISCSLLSLPNARFSKNCTHISRKLKTRPKLCLLTNQSVCQLVELSKIGWNFHQSQSFHMYLIW